MGAFLADINKGFTLKKTVSEAKPLTKGGRKTYDEIMKNVEQYVLEQWHDNYVATDLTGIPPMSKNELIKDRLEKRNMSKVEPPKPKKKVRKISPRK